MHDMRSPGVVRSRLGLIVEGDLQFPVCSLSSCAPKIKASSFNYLGGKNDGERVPDGKLTPGQGAIVSFGTVQPQSDIIVGVNPALLGIASVGNPVILQGARTERYAFFITVEAKKAVNLSELDWHVSVAAPN